MLRREVTSRWGAKSVSEIVKRDVIELASEIAQRGTRVAANKLLKIVKTFFNWCVGRAVIESSPADGVPLPGKEIVRDRVLSDRELAYVIMAARRMDGPYGAIVEMLALTGQAARGGRPDGLERNRFRHSNLDSPPPSRARTESRTSSICPHDPSKLLSVRPSWDLSSFRFLG